MGKDDEKKPVTEGLPEEAAKIPRANLWNSDYMKQGYTRQVYGDDTTIVLGMRFLNTPDIVTIEDWGCGYGGLKLYLAPHQEYTGIDGSCSRFADKIADLERYRSSADAVFLRHVLDHNPNWAKVLDNAVASFKKRMVLVLFTPYQEMTRVIREYPDWGGSGCSMFDIGFRREDITERLTDCDWSSQENIPTRTGYAVEHIFYLDRRPGELNPA